MHAFSLAALLACVLFTGQCRYHFVFDLERDLSLEQSSRLDSLFRAHETTTGNEIVLVTDSTFNGRSAKDFAVEFGNAHGVGKAERNNGVVIAFSRAQRSLFIATGIGTERVLTDSICQELVDSLMLPQIRRDSTYAGLWAGSVALIEVLERPDNNIR